MSEVTMETTVVMDMRNTNDDRVRVCVCAVCAKLFIYLGLKNMKPLSIGIAKVLNVFQNRFLIKTHMLYLQNHSCKSTTLLPMPI